MYVSIHLQLITLPRVELSGVLSIMKKMPFYKMYFLALFAFAVPTYALVSYLDFSSIGIGSPLITAFVVSMFPALLVSIWWWNYQDEE
jgi:hypothetical protein